MLTIIGSILCICPDPELLKPCICSNDEISCGGNDMINLKFIFQKVDQVLADNQKDFKKFYLNNTAITELEENTFFKLTFEEINITSAENLKLINTNAFSSTNMITKFLFIINCPIVYTPPDYDIFHATSLMLNIEKVWFRYTKLSKIPSHAFRPINGIQSKLWQLFVHLSPYIKEIGNFPFYYLPNLKELSLDWTSIEFIPSDAFHLEKGSNETITIDLDGLKLNGSSFGLHSFDNLKRPSHLILGGNYEMTYLNESIFAPYFGLNPKNTIDLRENFQLDCDDCRSYWIKKWYNYSDRIKTNNICSNGNDLRSDSNFKNCK